MRTVGVLIFLVILSACFVSGNIARYVSQGEAADEARVARFEVSETNNMPINVFVSMMPEDDPYQLQLEVDNDSETAVRYTLTIEEEGNLPLIYETVSNLTESGAREWYYDSAPEGGEATLKLDVKWDPDRPGYEYSAGVEMLTLTVEMTQID